MLGETYTLEWVLDFIANRIRGLREEKCLSAMGLSLSIGQNKTYIQKIENRQANVSIEGLYNICEYLGVTFEEFFDTRAQHPAHVQELVALAKPMDGDSIGLLIDMAKKIEQAEQRR